MKSILCRLSRMIYGFPTGIKVLTRHSTAIQTLGEGNHYAREKDGGGWIDTGQQLGQGGGGNGDQKGRLRVATTTACRRRAARRVR